ncbi:hypothetical protein GCM10009678_62460 [Actinomadura kijaniata]|uniref:Methyltransferase n=1 Tax=Actinomadura namibiensis TaxID=182080 RepID=A0A7W3LXZ9_ACTNM|nr:hypothetical protein [Actinomadura namibiensis]
MTGDGVTAQRMADDQADRDARVHADSEFYDLDRRPAHTRFHPREWQDLEPLGGRAVLHLQCHNGAETLAFAQRGAHVTGRTSPPPACARPAATPTATEPTSSGCAPMSTTPWTPWPGAPSTWCTPDAGP